MNVKSKKLIADSIAFLKNCPLQEYAEDVLTTPSVIAEIKDLATKERLQVLPYELKIREPSTEAIKFVTEFSKRTGDYSVLSTVDIQVIALTYQIALEEGLQEKLKKEPVINKTVQVGSGGEKPTQGPENIPGFHKSTKGEEKEEEVSSEADEDHSDIPVTESKPSETPETNRLEGIVSEVAEAVAKTHITSEGDLSVVGEEHSESEGDSESVSEDEESDDDGGWITPSNIKEAKNAMRERGVKDDDPMEQVQVACLTGDFAMQNVLKQIGLSILSPDGRVIRNVRTYILRCYACFKTTTVMTKEFCPSCGHKTLKRVAASLNEDGTLQIYLSSRKVLTSRGKKFPLPLPKGGKHVKNPVLFENQREAEKRATKLARQKNNPLDDDYIAGNTPFVIRDVNSKASLLGRAGNEKLEYWERRNPNAVTNRGGRRRRK